jgi:hypothetical protein
VSKEEHVIVWNYQHQIDTDKDDTREYQNYKIPGLLLQDAQNPNNMFLIGRLEGSASVIKFSKSNFNIQWKVLIGNMDVDDTTMKLATSNSSATHMTEIHSAVQP